MTYLGRPVFEFAIDWADKVNKTFTYDLREVALGFGAEIFTSLQQYVVQGYQITVDSVGNEAIKEFDDFTAALGGRLVGFWLPAPFEAMSVASVVDSTHFDIPYQGLSDTWDDHPDIYLFFIHSTDPLVASVPSKITAVIDLGTGYERVTLNAAVSFLGARPIIRRLHYVRLADDVEGGSFQRENWLRREVKVLELPSEYAAAETGQRPVYLYHFFAGEPMGLHWRYTSFAAPVVSQNKLFSVAPISHGTLRYGTNAKDETLDITAGYDPDGPLALFFPLPASRPIRVEVTETTIPALALWQGGVQQFDNLSGITVNDHAAATPYPSTIHVSGVVGTFTKLRVKLHGLTHGRPHDLQILLQGPGGQNTILTANAGGTPDVTDLEITFADSGEPLPQLAQLVAGTYKPTSHGATTFPSPAPAGPYALPPNPLADFLASDPNGDWKLWVKDEVIGGGAGTLSGWSLEITTTAVSPPRVIFAGQVRSVEDDGDRLLAKTDSLTALMKRRIPAMAIQADCNYQVYEPRTCRAARATFETTAVIVTISNDARPPIVVLALDFPTDDRASAGWFDQGWIEFGTEARFQVRTILSSAYDLGLALLTITINAPLFTAVAGDKLQIIPGCNGAAATCRTKFNNFVNFGGFVAIPDRNLSLQAVDNKVSVGDKK